MADGLESMLLVEACVTFLGGLQVTWEAFPVRLRKDGPQERATDPFATVIRIDTNNRKVPMLRRDGLLPASPTILRAARRRPTLATSDIVRQVVQLRC